MGSSALRAGKTRAKKLPRTLSPEDNPEHPARGEDASRSKSRVQVVGFAVRLARVLSLGAAWRVARARDMGGVWLNGSRRANGFRRPCRLA